MKNKIPSFRSALASAFTSLSFCAPDDTEFAGLELAAEIDRIALDYANACAQLSRDLQEEILRARLGRNLLDPMRSSLVRDLSELSTRHEQAIRHFWTFTRAAFGAEVHKAARAAFDAAVSAAHREAAKEAQ